VHEVTGATKFFIAARRKDSFWGSSVRNAHSEKSGTWSANIAAYDLMGKTGMEQSLPS